jgi:hypothetical protein
MLNLTKCFLRGRMAEVDIIISQRDWTVFFISEDLVMLRLRYRSWVYNTKISYHMSFILHLENNLRHTGYPFKFNSMWFEDPNFKNLVRTNWNGLLGNEFLSPLEALVKKLKVLNILVIKWERKKKLEAKVELVKIENELDTLYTNHPEDFEEEVDRALVLEKEQRKLTLLREVEETWRQKSRINWLASGDRNTKFFHAYANSRKIINSIWDIKKEDCTVINWIHDLHKEVVGFFHNTFKAHE